jgi:hypothetical protein
MAPWLRVVLGLLALAAVTALACILVAAALSAGGVRFGAS